MEHLFQGIGVSPGIASGPAFLFQMETASTRTPGDPTEEREAYERAVSESVSQLGRIASSLRFRGLLDEAGIIDAQAVMLRDPVWEDVIRREIAAHAPVEAAVRVAEEQFVGLFEALDDPYLAGRAADVRDIATRLRDSLADRESTSLTVPSIVIAHDLTPSQTAALDRNLVLGFAVEVGSRTSHTAILARALDIPAVVGLIDITAQVASGHTVALDGERGTVLVDPSETASAALAVRAETEQKRRARLRAAPAGPVQTQDGHRITIAANIGSPLDLPAALDVGAEGVGLFRTEFLFAQRETLPTEDEQVEAYRAVLSAMSGHRVVVRTLDIGGDKPLPAVTEPAEANPFLGRRGVRFTSAHPDLLRTQLRALLRASSSGNLAIMFPMISDLAEIEFVSALIEELRTEVGGEAEIGIMVEVPAAALMADVFSRRVAFLSAGTNDLTQYVLAVDRTNSSVASLYNPLHPAVLRLLRSTVKGAHAQKRWAGVCGEMAGDRLAIPLLLGFGFDELSMTPSRISEARERIRSLTLNECRDITEAALTCGTAAEVETLVREKAGE